MGLGRLAHGDKRPVRGVPFNIEKLRKEVVTSNTVVKEGISVVQCKGDGGDVVNDNENLD